MNQGSLVIADRCSINGLKPIHPAFRTVEYCVVDSMTCFWPEGGNGLIVVLYPLPVIPIAEIDIGSTIEKLMLIKGLYIAFALHFDPASGVGNTVDITIIGETKNPWAQGQKK